MTAPLTEHTPSPLPPELVADLHRCNPWWDGNPAPPTPGTRRHLAARTRRLLDSSIAPTIAVRGPRQVGKTTIQLQIISDLLAEGVPPNNIMRIQFDDLSSTEGLIDPILRIADWLEREVATDAFNNLAHRGQTVYLFLDEVHKIGNWSSQLKFLVDTTTVKILVTDSSSMRIEQGRDSLAGRIYTVDAGTLSLTEIAEFRGMARLDPFLPEISFGILRQREFWQELAEHGRAHSDFRDLTFHLFSERGGFPMAHDPRQLQADWAILARQLNENVMQQVLQQVLQHDLLTGPQSQRGDNALLEKFFELACRHAGRTTTLSLLAQGSHRSTSEDVGPHEIRNHLQVLADTLLLRLVPETVERLSTPRDYLKICLADHALRACWIQEQVPLAPLALATRPELANQAKHIAGSVLGATASNIRDLTTSLTPDPNRGPKLDFLLWAGDQQIPVAMKYQRRIDAVRDTQGIRSFLEAPANRAPFGLFITQEDPPAIDDPRVVAMPLSTFLLLA